jgi:hypothetical protein
MSDESPRFIYLHLRAQFLCLLLLHRISKNLSEALEKGPLKVRLIEVSWEGRRMSNLAIKKNNWIG